MAQDRVSSFDNLPATAKLSAREIADIISINEKTVWRWVKAGILPQPQRISTRCTRWSVGDVRKALAQKSGG